MGIKDIQIITLVKSPATEVKVVIQNSPYVHSDDIYLIPEGDVSLLDYAATYKQKLAALERRYAYLERARDWILSNLRTNK